MGRGKSSTLRRPAHPTGRIETAAERRERMSSALKDTLANIEAYDQAPEAFEESLDELVVSLGTIGANLHAEGASETIEPEPPTRDDPSRNALGRSLLWLGKDGLPQSLRGPLYEVKLTESRWRKLPRELRDVVTYYGFKRDFVGRSAQYAYERLESSRMPADSLAAFRDALLVYA
jgi:hypothetical protein